MNLLILFALCLVPLFVWLAMTPSQTKGMAPVSGPRYKRWLAFFLIQFGKPQIYQTIAH